MLHTWSDVTVTPLGTTSAALLPSVDDSYVSPRILPPGGVGNVAIPPLMPVHGPDALVERSTEYPNDSTVVSLVAVTVSLLNPSNAMVASVTVDATASGLGASTGEYLISGNGADVTGVSAFVP